MTKYGILTVIELYMYEAKKYLYIAFLTYIKAGRKQAQINCVWLVFDRDDCVSLWVYGKWRDSETINGKHQKWGPKI